MIKRTAAVVTRRELGLAGRDEGQSAGGCGSWPGGGLSGLQQRLGQLSAPEPFVEWAYPFGDFGSCPARIFGWGSDLGVSAAVMAVDL